MDNDKIKEIYEKVMNGNYDYIVYLDELTYLYCSKLGLNTEKLISVDAMYECLMDMASHYLKKGHFPSIMIFQLIETDTCDRTNFLLSLYYALYGCLKARGYETNYIDQLDDYLDTIHFSSVYEYPTHIELGDREYSEKREMLGYNIAASINLGAHYPSPLVHPATLYYPATILLNDSIMPKDKKQSFNIWGEELKTYSKIITTDDNQVKATFTVRWCESEDKNHIILEPFIMLPPLNSRQCDYFYETIFKKIDDENIKKTIRKEYGISRSFKDSYAGVQTFDRRFLSTILLILNHELSLSFLEDNGIDLRKIDMEEQLINLKKVAMHYGGEKDEIIDYIMHNRIFTKTELQEFIINFVGKDSLLTINNKKEELTPQDESQLLRTVEDYIVDAYNKNIMYRKNLYKIDQLSVNEKMKLLHDNHSVKYLSQQFVEIDNLLSMIQKKYPISTSTVASIASYLIFFLDKGALKYEDLSLYGMNKRLSHSFSLGVNAKLIQPLQNYKYLLFYSACIPSYINGDPEWVKQYIKEKLPVEDAEKGIKLLSDFVKLGQSQHIAKYSSSSSFLFFYPETKDMMTDINEIIKFKLKRNDELNSLIKDFRGCAKQKKLSKR